MRRALTKLLLEDHLSIAKRRCKRQDNNEQPKYQSVRVLFLSAAFSLIEFSRAAVQHIAAPSEELSSITLFYGNEGARFPINLSGGLVPSQQTAHSTFSPMALRQLT
jgi:hypothetical protein